MSIIETVLVFVGIPAGLFALVAILVLVPTASRTARYRPSGGWKFASVWYLPHPDGVQPVSALHAADVGEAGRQLTGHASASPAVPASGGASGEW